MRPLISVVHVERTETWTRYRKGPCEGCWARCCTMPGEVRLDDLPRLGLVEGFDADQEQPRVIARRLENAGVVARHTAKDGIFALAQRAGGDCLYLHPQTRRWLNGLREAPGHLPQAPAGGATAGGLRACADCAGRPVKCRAEARPT
jgi:hypothetical protein